MASLAKKSESTSMVDHLKIDTGLSGLISGRTWWLRATDQHHHFMAHLVNKTTLLRVKMLTMMLLGLILIASLAKASGPSVITAPLSFYMSDTSLSSNQQLTTANPAISSPAILPPAQAGDKGSQQGVVLYGGVKTACWGDPLTSVVDLKVTLNGTYVM